MHNRNITFLLIGYFAGLALLIGGLASVGIKPDEQTVLGGMAIVAAVFALLWLIGKLIKHQLDKVGYSGKQWAATLLGASPEIVDAIPHASSPSTSLAVSHYGTEIVPYEYDEENNEDWSTFIEQEGLDLAEVFKPSIHSLLGQMVLVLGIRRYGKSNCIAVIIEALAPHQLPMLVCDTKDEYAGLVNPRVMPYPVMAGAPGATANVPQAAKAFYTSVDAAGAFQFGQALMDGHFQCVMNLKSYETDDLAAKVMCEIIRGINAWQEQRPNDERVPVEVVLSEGHKWLPQNESNELSKETQAMLHKTFFSTIVRLGGAYGFGFIVDSQRISELDKRCLQSSWKFLFRQTETIDIKKYEEYGLKREEILALQPGECFVFSPKVLGFPIKMHRKQSPDLSMTPGYAQLLKHRQAARAKHQYLAHRQTYTRQLPEHETDPMPEQHVDHGYQRQAVNTPPPVQTEPVKSFHDEVLEQWHKGLHTHRAIAAAIDKPESAVYSMLVRLETEGYIQRKKRVTA